MRITLPLRMRKFVLVWLTGLNDVLVDRVDVVHGVDLIGVFGDLLVVDPETTVCVLIFLCSSSALSPVDLFFVLPSLPPSFVRATQSDERILTPGLQMPNITGVCVWV